MKMSGWIALLAFAAFPGCGPANPVTPETPGHAEDSAVTMATLQTEAATVQGSRYDPYAADNDENGWVCSAPGGEGPYIDDVVPPRRIVVRIKPHPNPPPVQRFRCVSPAYPEPVFLDGS